MRTKLCCDIYESDLARLFLGESMHVGGLDLTKKLCNSVPINKKDKVLDIGCGYGTSSIFVAKEFGCHVTGIDASKKMIEYGCEKAREGKISKTVKLMEARAEDLNMTGFDAVICECVLSLLDDKRKASDKIFSCLAYGGRFALSDFVIESELPKRLDNLFAYMSCISNAESHEEYKNIFESSGFTNFAIQNCDRELNSFIKSIERKIKLASMLIGKDTIKEVIGMETDEIEDVVKDVKLLAESGKIKYCIMTLVK